MTDASPRGEPNVDAARAAAAAVLDREVTAATRIPTGVNALYRVELADGGRAVLKAPQYADDNAFLVEPTLFDRIRHRTAVPVPRVLGRATADDGPLETAYYVMEHVDGRTVAEVLTLSADAHSHLVREAGRHLAAVHDISVSLPWGPVHAVDGELVCPDPGDSWAATFETLAGEAVAALRGEGPLADEDARFADLARPVEAALTEPGPSFAGASVAPSFVVRDYRPANLVLAPADGADPFVRAVLDVGGLVGDGLLDVAMAEDALIDTPLGGTERADSLRETFRDAYAAGRGVDRGAVFDGRYPYYRLYTRVDRLSAFEYLQEFAREDDTDTTARRWRSFVDDRLTEIRAQ